MCCALVDQKDENPERDLHHSRPDLSYLHHSRGVTARLDGSDVGSRPSKFRRPEPDEANHTTGRLCSVSRLRKHERCLDR